PTGQGIGRRDHGPGDRIDDPGRTDADPPLGHGNARAGAAAGVGRSRMAAMVGLGLTIGAVPGATAALGLGDDGGGRLGDGVEDGLRPRTRRGRHGSHMPERAVDEGPGTDLRASDIDGDDSGQSHSSPEAVTISRTFSASAASRASIGSAIRFELMTPMSRRAVLNPPRPAAPAETRPGVAAPVISNSLARRSCSLTTVAQSPTRAASKMRT